MKKRLSIIIPAHNEEGNLPALMDRLIDLRKEEGWDCEIVVVNDNSSDATGDIADEYSLKHSDIVVLHREKGDNGMGYALIDGTNKSSGDVVIWLMADCSDDLGALSRILGKMDETYDMVIGSRYMPGGSRGELSQDKALLGKTYTALSRFIFGIPVNDITNAFRGFKRNVFEGAAPESGDFAISPEFSIKAHMRGYKLGEVPTTYFNRKAGKAKFKMMKMGMRYASLFKYRFTG